MINDTKGIYLKIIVIGGGTGGYVAAPLASQLGAEATWWRRITWAARA